jgi:hypothetical protein
MRLPEFTAAASLGKTSKHYVLTSEHTAGASTRSLQPQLYTGFVPSKCFWAMIDCTLFKQCDYYFTQCGPPVNIPLPPSDNPGPPPGPGSTHVVAVF